MRHAIRISIVCLLWLSAGAAAAQTTPAAAAAPQSGSNDFLRIAKNAAGEPRAFQTSIVHLAPDSASISRVTVDLVAAVHIGDARYYEELNARFRDYDSVLYELVAPQGTRVPLGGGPRRSLVSSVQSGMTDVLGLAFQLEKIDYTRPNFVHSDLSPDEMARSMAERGESAADYLWKAMGVSLNEQAKDPFGLQGFAMLVALLSPDRERLLKIQLASSMLNLDQITAVIEGKEGSSLIGERNKRAVTVLEDRIRRGDKRIAIFYGAAHMTDMAKRIESELGLRRVGSEWLDAWDLR
ncbi:MAG TPA: hypothetical protein VFJ95_16425 [Gammaproteobacteria bacterium]|nr:hypothetical protein [Gammaproteobacteria bacterium]